MFEAKTKRAQYCSDKCRYRMNSRVSDRKRVPNDVRFRILRRDNFTCRYCGKRPPEVAITAREKAAGLKLDHIVPVAAGGPLMGWDNFATACEECNAGKGDLVIDPSEVPPIG